MSVEGEVGRDAVKWSWLVRLAGSTALVFASAPMAQPLLGDLPPGAISSFEVSDVRAEICRTLLFPADAMPVAMPAGFRLSKLSERTKVPAVAALLLKRPELRDYARGAFCFIDAGVHKVDGIPLYPGRSRTAFLWADMVPAETAPSDSRQLGARGRTQLFWIYDKRDLDKELAKKAIPDALFGTIEITPTDSGWSASLQTENGKLEVRAVPKTPRVPLVHPLPAFETVPLANAGRDYFLVLTYAGHHDRKAVSEWQASGSDPWVRTVIASVTAEGADFVQDGFSVKLNLYKTEPPRSSVEGTN